MEIWSLNEEQSVAFVETLLNPPEPSEKLKEAVARYKKLFTDVKE